MENIQINGQKIWGPPKDWVGAPPPHGTEVFIKNIPDDVFEDELYYLFSTVGKIYEVRLPVYWTGINKGYAFVRFTKISEADAAIEKLNQCMIRQGREIKVERSLDNTRLFLSSVPNDKTAEEIKSDLLTVVDNVKTVYVYSASENPTVYRGYAFVEFMCHRDAAIAKRILTPDVLFNLFERKCVAAWANPLPFLSKEALKNINILFLRNIPNSTKTISIKMAVDSLISPESVHKVKRLNDYGFLTFKNHDIAERAMIKIKSNPFFLGTKAVNVEWAIPRELVNSVTSKDLVMEKCDGSDDSNLESNAGSCHSLFKVLSLNKTGHQIEDMNVRCMNAVNFENQLSRNFSNNVNVKIIQKKPELCDSWPVNEIETHNRKPEAKKCMENYLHQININNSSKLSTFMRDIPNLKNNPYNDSFITESHYRDSENYCKNMHLKNWLQSLALSDQFTSHTTSPILTSSSTGSSTNMSWKWDEGCSQFSSGSGISVLETDKKTQNSSAFEEQDENYREGRLHYCRKRTNKAKHHWEDQTIRENQNESKVFDSNTRNSNFRDRNE